MAPFWHSGPICQSRDRFEVLDDGQLTWAFPARPTGANAPATPPAPPAPATGDCAFLNPRAIGTVQAPHAAFDRLRGNSSAATKGQPKAVDPFKWPHGPPSAAVEQEVTIDGQKIKVVMPTDADAKGKNLPTIDQLCEALRAVPADQRALTKRVMLSPRDNPGTHPGHTVAGEGGSGDITLFPMAGTQSQNDVDNRVMHECAHNYHGKFWTSGSDVSDWANTAASDNRLPSPYAGENAGEDFCEFLILFNAARGTACEASARRLYPNRWARMLRYIGQGGGPGP